MTDLNEEIVSVTTRGISGNLTLSSSTYRDGQKLLDTLNFTNIPSLIVLVLKDVIKDSVFDFINFGNKRIYLEISSYFHIKHKISFNELHQLFIKLNEIPKESERKSLTSFIEVKNLTIEKELKKSLFYELREDSANKYGPGRGKHPHKLDIDFIHPSKVKEFYESDFFEIKPKNAKKGIEIRERNNLYEEGLKYIYEKTNHLDQFGFDQFMGGLRVYSCKGKLKIKAMFWQYLTCELSYRERPIFHIDGNWYEVKDDFKELINNRCSLTIDNNFLVDNLLFQIWDYTSADEDAYNSKYRGIPGYHVFDKALGQNIELCDIMFDNETEIYFIHVKSGFDAKIRDLSNQITISANRFMNDRNSGSTTFVGDVIDSYNRKGENADYQIDKQLFLDKFKTGGKNIIYVMAFKPEQKSIPEIKGNVHRVKSNIAKFSLIQCVREMNSMSYPLKIVEIKRA